MGLFNWVFTLVILLSFFLSCLCTFISIYSVSWQKGPLVSMPLSLSLSLFLSVSISFCLYLSPM